MAWTLGPPPPRPATTLLCARCGILVARVRDARFGLPPTSTLCVRCGHPAHRA